jgi:hypothetical protein
LQDRREALYDYAMMYNFCVEQNGYNHRCRYAEFIPSYTMLGMKEYLDNNGCIIGDKGLVTMGLGFDIPQYNGDVINHL